MLRWMMTLLCALSVAAVAQAQDDDLDALLAGLGDDSFADVSDEAGTVAVEETAVVEEDPFADFFSEAEEIPEVAENAAAEADTAAETAFEEVAEFSEAVEASVADTADELSESVETAVAEAGDAFGEDAFAGFFDDIPAEAEAPAETVTVAEVTEVIPEAGEDFADFAEDTATEIADAAADIPEAVEAGIDEAFGNEGFDDFMADFPEEAPAEEVAAAVEDTVEATAGDFAGAFPEADPVAEPEPEVAAEQIAVEQLAAEAETAIPGETDFATFEEGEAAAAIISQRVRPVEPDVKPAKEKKDKKDKFSSEARKPIKSKTPVPAWDEPVSFDGSAIPEPVAAPAGKPAERPASRGAWDEPVVW